MWVAEASRVSEPPSTIVYGPPAEATTGSLTVTSRVVGLGGLEPLLSTRVTVIVYDPTAA